MSSEEREIEKLKKELEECRRENFLFRRIVEDLPLGVQIFDKEGYSWFVNNKQKDILGLPNLSEGIGQFNVLNDPYSISMGVDVIYKKVYQGEIYSHNFNYDLGNSSNKWKTRREKRLLKEEIFPFITESGDVESVFAIIEDITEKEERQRIQKELNISERRWRFAVEGNKDGLWEWNLKTNEVYFSTEWKKMLGFEESEINNVLDEWDKRVHPEDKEEVYKKINRHVSGLDEVYKSEHRVLCKNGEFIWVLDRGKILEWDDDGKPLIMIGTHSDINKAKENEIRLRELLLTKDKLFSIIAHDLRGPFSSLLGMTKILSSKLHKISINELREFVNLIYDSTQKGYNLLNNLLEWARVQTGSIDFNPETIDLNTLLLELLDFFAVSKSEKHINIDLAIEPNLKVKADMYMLSTVIRNLVSNAIKFTNKGGEILISAISSNNKVEFSVEDNGLGISKDNLKNLFTVENKFSMPGTEDEIGTGLGLVLCNEFLLKHNTEIKVESEEGKGAKFYFFIDKA